MQVQAGDAGIRVNMIDATNRLFCNLDGLSPTVREENRVAILKKLNLLEAGTVPVFDEATQTAAHFIEAPICILGVMVREELWFKSAVGLSRLGLMNQLASSRKISRQEAFSTYVVDSQQTLIINDTFTNPVFARSILAQHYGIRAYLGTPLIAAEGQCIGTLAVMDLVPRQFSDKDIEFLALSARWCLREFERNSLLSDRSTPNPFLLDDPHQSWDLTPPREPQKTAEVSIPRTYTTNEIKLRFFEQLIENFRTPLTSVVGMTSVLLGEVFGTLTNKQKEYLEIIHGSGQQMNSVVEEILKLGIVNSKTTQPQLAPVNIEMLCQQALSGLGQFVKHKQQQIRLSVEPGNRIWLLDKEKARQALYYLVMSAIESSEVGSEVRIHVSRRSETLNIAVWVSHPWLGDGLPQVVSDSSSLTNSLVLLGQEITGTNSQSQSDRMVLDNHLLTTSVLESVFQKKDVTSDASTPQIPQELLGLFLSCHLTESLGGRVVIQGSSELGYRYVLMLPKIATDEKPEESHETT